MISSLSSPCSSRVSSVLSSISYYRDSDRQFSGKASNHAVILPKSEYERIKSAANLVSREQRFQAQDEFLKERLEKLHFGLDNVKIQESPAEKPNYPLNFLGCSKEEKELECVDGHSTKQEANSPTSSSVTLNNLEEVHKREALLDELKQRRIEQDDDIKKTEAMIREVKCLAVRENQILEKELRLKAAKKQEQELEKKLTEQQLALDRKLTKLECKRKLEQKRYAELVKQQMDEHQAHKALAEKRLRDWEALEIQRKMDQFKKQQTLEKLQKRTQQQKLKDGLQECVKEKSRLQKKLKEQEIKQLETIQKQQVCKELFEATLQEEKEKRDRLVEARSAFISKLWSADKTGSKESYDAKARREREELDRLWRKNELESALKSSKEKESLRLIRKHQVMEKAKEREAAELQTKKEHQEVIEADQRALEIQKLQSKQRRLEGLKYMSEIHKQILDNEERRQHQQSELLEDVTKYRRRIAEHERQIQEVKARKLQDLKSLDLPEKYLKEVARKSKIPWDNIVS